MHSYCYKGIIQDGPCPRIRNVAKQNIKPTANHSWGSLLSRSSIYDLFHNHYYSSNDVVLNFKLESCHHRHSPWHVLIYLLCDTSSQYALKHSSFLPTSWSNRSVGAIFLIGLGCALVHIHHLSHVAAFQSVSQCMIQGIKSQTIHILVRQCWCNSHVLMYILYKLALS